MTEDDSRARHYLAFSGGVGGAKLALGLSRCLDPDELTIVANTGDDFEHLGLHIAPDLDTVMYTLAGLSDQDKGWGLEGESWNFLSALESLQGETWFQLGDRDLATHVQRTHWLRSGQSLGEVTRRLSEILGVSHRILPMSDDAVRTIVHSEHGELAFQHYFVRQRCAPRVSGFHFEGVQQASPHPGFLQSLADPSLRAVIICPSNPFVSVDPILHLPGVRQALQQCAAPVIAVSPIVGGIAIKGPAAKMMLELGMPVTALGVAEHYQGLIDGLVVDESDATLVGEIEGLGMHTAVTRTVMRTLADREALGRFVIDWSEAL